MILKDILENYIPVTESGCYIWMGYYHRQGYGSVMYKGKSKLAHRIFYEAYNGTIKDGEVVRHKCDTPSCVNPSHLEIGTQKDNIADMYARGRERHLNGEDKPNAKFTNKDIIFIRESLLPQKELGLMFGVGYKYISKIKTRYVWKHVRSGD